MAIELDGLFGITSGGNITTGNYFIGNGYYLTNVQSSFNDANVIALLASGNIAVANITTINSTAVNTTDLTVYGNSAVTQINVTGNTTSGNIYSDNYYYANGQPFVSGAGTGIVVGDQQITGNGAASYPLTQAATTQSVIVALNGITQYPATAYTVAGNVITFSSTINNASVIDVRYFAEGGSNVYGNANVASFLPTYSGSLTSAIGAPLLTVESNATTSITVSQQVTAVSNPLTVTATLPALSTSMIGSQYTIIDTWGGDRGNNPIDITVANPGTELIDGATTTQIGTSYGVTVLVCVSATQWIIVVSN